MPQSGPARGHIRGHRSANWGHLIACGGRPRGAGARAAAVMPPGQGAALDGSRCGIAPHGRAAQGGALQPWGTVGACRGHRVMQPGAHWAQSLRGDDHSQEPHSLPPPPPKPACAEIGRRDRSRSSTRQRFAPPSPCQRSPRQPGPAGVKCTVKLPRDPLTSAASRSLRIRRAEVPGGPARIQPRWPAAGAKGYRWRERC